MFVVAKTIVLETVVVLFVPLKHQVVSQFDFPEWFRQLQENQRAINNMASAEPHKVLNRHPLISLQVLPTKHTLN
jgi:hypothetical protein